MPSAETFSIPPIAELLDRWLPDSGVVDPFARNSKRASFCNDLNPETTAHHHLEAADFCDELLRGGLRARAVLFDPPYSLTQVSRSYQDIGLQFKGSENPTGGFPLVRARLAQLLDRDGIAVCCGWNSCGLGLKRGFALLEVLLVCHGGNRNDTIVTVERKVQWDLSL